MKLTEPRHYQNSRKMTKETIKVVDSLEVAMEVTKDMVEIKVGMIPDPIVALLTREIITDSMDREIRVRMDQEDKDKMIARLYSWEI